jgi:hypothetical protein
MFRVKQSAPLCSGRNPARAPTTGVPRVGLLFDTCSARSGDFLQVAGLKAIFPLR